MSNQSVEWRKHAERDRAAAEVCTLPNMKAKLLASAVRFTELADQAERIDRIKQDRVERSDDYPLSSRR